MTGCRLSDSNYNIKIIQKLGVIGVIDGVVCAAKLEFSKGGKKGLLEFMRDNPWLDVESQNFIADVLTGNIKAKRGPKPKVKTKPEKLVVSNRRGRPKIHSDRSKERLVKTIDGIKLKNGFVTDKEAIFELLIAYLGKSPRTAREEFGRYKILLSKARNKK